MERNRKAPPFKQRLQTALDAARAAGSTRLKVKTPDGAEFDFDFTEGQAVGVNDFDRPANRALPKRGKKST